MQCENQRLPPTVIQTNYSLAAMTSERGHLYLSRDVIDVGDGVILAVQVKLLHEVCSTGDGWYDVRLLKQEGRVTHGN